MKMPAQIAKAITATTLEVEGLVRDQDNSFAKYRFVSHDQIKAKAGKIMAKHGLIIVANEVASAVDGKALHCEYEFWLYHESGVEYGPIRRTVQVPANGAQAYGGAASYAQKYFLRDIFQIPTGEGEDENIIPKHDLLDLVPTISKKSSEKIRDDLLDDLMKCKTKAEANAWAEKNSAKKGQMLDEDKETVTTAYNDLKESFNPPKTLELK